MHYAKVYRQLWNDDKFRSLPEDARQFWQYLLTSPYGNSLGYFILDDGTAAGDLQWSSSRLNRAKKCLTNSEMVSWDPKNRLYFLANSLKYNQPDNQNVLKSWTRLLLALPKSELFTEFCKAAAIYLDTDYAKNWANSLETLYDTVSKPFTEPFTKPYTKPFRIPVARSPNPEPVALTRSPNNDNPLPPSPPDRLLLSSDKQGEGKNVFEIYEEEVGQITESVRNVLVDAVEDYTEEWVRDAIKEAVLQGHPSWSYIEGILKNWGIDGRDAEKPASGRRRYFKGKLGALVRDDTFKDRTDKRTMEEMQAEIQQAESP